MSALADRVPDRQLAEADHMDRLEGSDGRPYYVIEYVRRGEKDLVHADVVEYGRLDHPIGLGLLGFVIVALSLLGPMYVGYQFAAGATGSLLSALSLGVGVVAGWALGTVALHYSPFGDWLYRFLEWNEHKTKIMHGRPG